MKERPILMKGAMVCAVLDGRKTQTRRIIKPQPDCIGGMLQWTKSKSCYDITPGKTIEYSPYGRIDDRLWVRETFAELIAVSPSTNEPFDITPGERLIEAPTSWTDQNGRKRWHFDGQVIAYWANSNVEFCDGDGFIGESANKADMPRWKPSIFMRRSQSRLTLEIEEIRTERLNEISEEDARAEGGPSILGAAAAATADSRQMGWLTYRHWYAWLWNDINGPGAWEQNPWVWVVTFRKITP